MASQKAMKESGVNAMDEEEVEKIVSLPIPSYKVLRWALLMKQNLIFG